MDNTDYVGCSVLKKFSNQQNPFCRPELASQDYKNFAIGPPRAAIASIFAETRLSSINGGA